MTLKKNFMLLACLSLLNGCAMFKVGDLPPARLSPAAAGSIKPSLTYTLQAETKIFGSQPAPEVILKKMRKEFEQAAQETGCFSQTSSYNKNADIRLNIILTDSGNPAAIIPAFFTGFSMFTIPSWATDHYEIRATAQSGTCSRMYVVKDDVRLFQWLPLAFVFPFHNFSTVTDVHKNMYKTVVQQMQADGLLVKKEVINPESPKETPPINTTVTESAETSPAI